MERQDEIRDLLHYYPEDDVQQGMWLPRAAEPLADRTLPGELAGLFVQLKRRLLTRLGCSRCP